MPTPSPLLGPLEWLVVQAELPADELPGFLAYLAAVHGGESELHHPDSAPYRLTPKAATLKHYDVAKGQAQ